MCKLKTVLIDLKNFSDVVDKDALKTLYDYLVIPVNGIKDNIHGTSGPVRKS